jgi:ribonucleoside-diphosphate reductase alpha chain
MSDTVINRPASKVKGGKGLTIERIYTNEGIHPYDEVTWDRRDVVQQNWKTGEVAFEQLGVEFPLGWSLYATNIVGQKNFLDTPDTDEREWSLKQVADRVADTITDWGIRDGYFVSDEEAEAFRAELKFIIITQRAAFNSPVWFNIGVEGVPQQASACFIQSVEDTMEDIMRLATSEAMLFKYGSGTGTDLSTIRSSKEKLTGGGTASGPLSFLRIYDQVANAVKSV